MVSPEEVVTKGHEKKPRMIPYVVQMPLPDLPEGEADTRPEPMKAKGHFGTTPPSISPEYGILTSSPIWPTAEFVNMTPAIGASKQKTGTVVNGYSRQVLCIPSE